ncbi:hypothetical protein ACJ73_07162 [Blastomyces percursus]|uniref:Uncharacterized protein n=1 Tax=Blastomyces percursus TaxID=1658174 RepID=A0A1J9R0D3_9EURO|nr:hypothetical protein ACJ73_07162 [Blastomyces percursus]
MARKEQRKKERLEAAQHREKVKAAAAAKRLIEKQQRDERKLQLQKEKEERAAKCHEAQLTKQALMEASKRPTRRSTVGAKHCRSSIQPSRVVIVKCHPQPTPVESNDNYSFSEPLLHRDLIQPFQNCRFHVLGGLLGQAIIL